MDSIRSAERNASDWLARRETTSWSAAEEAALAAWLEASTANRVAFLRLQAGWKAMDRLKALGAGFARGAVPTPEQLEPRAPGWRRLSREALATQQKRRQLIGENASHPATGEAGARASGRVRVLFFASAAGVLAALGIVHFGYQTFAGDRYSTPVGGVTSIPLEDGSIVTLNTSTRVRVLFSQERRLVRLEGGEAFFDVARDPARPFSVESGNRRVTALGTRFSVRRNGGDVQIVVTDGKVRLGSAVLLTAGAVAETRDDRLTVQRRALPGAEELLSWRSGYLVFNETTLADAVAEFNRYNARTIRIADAGVAGMRISGKFRSTNFESFARLLQDSHRISARRVGDAIVLTGEP